MARVELTATLVSENSFKFSWSITFRISYNAILYKSSIDILKFFTQSYLLFLHNNCILDLRYLKYIKFLYNLWSFSISYSISTKMLIF